MTKEEALAASLQSSEKREHYNEDVASREEFSEGQEGSGEEFLLGGGVFCVHCVKKYRTNGQTVENMHGKYTSP